MSDLGVMLRRWRERLTPAQTGLAQVGGRRTPGLRREELAQLAGISVDYLTRLEQGRVTTPSDQVLDALAGALRLTSDEREHLFRLAARSPRLDRMRTTPTPGIRRLLEQLPSPVCVYDACWTQLAWNRSFAALLGDPAGFRGLEANLIHRYLVDAPTRVLREPAEGEDYLHAYVADLRSTVARFPKDARVTRLVASLRQESQTFARIWDEGTEVGAVHETRKRVAHPDLGVLDLDCDVLAVDGADLRIVVFTAPEGSTTADALALLASVSVSSS